MSRNSIVKGHDAFRCMMPLVFLDYANDFVKAGRSLGMKHSFPPVSYYLYCKSIELSLKAFLLTENKQVNTRKIHHDLESALEKAERRGLLNIVEIPCRYKEELRKANYFYKEKAFDYFDNYEVMRKEIGTEMSSEVLYEFASMLVEKLRKVCSESSYNLVKKAQEGKLEISRKVKGDR